MMSKDICSTGEKLTIEQREQVARRAIFDRLARIEQQLFTLGDEEAAGHCAAAMDAMNEKRRSARADNSRRGRREGTVSEHWQSVVDEMLSGENLVKLTVDARGIRMLRAMRAEIERLRAEVAMWQHRDECAAYEIGGVICAECDRLETAAKAAGGGETQ